MALRVAVIGTGYLGVTHAACMAESGLEVRGLDIDAGRVAALARGAVPFHEPGLSELVARHVASGRLGFTTSWAEVAAFADVHFLCVGTPQRPDGRAADLRFLEDAVDTLAPHLQQRCLVVGKCTVPAGTASRLAERLSQRAPVGADAELAWNPEFLREGTAVRDTLQPDRIVLGVRSPWGEKVLREVYAGQLDRGTPLMVTDVATAELIKVAANAFLATKLSFINVMAEMCEATGADVVALEDALGMDERIGRPYLNAGVGFGGGCLPKDLRALIAQAEDLGVPHVAALFGEVDAVNTDRRRRIVAIAEAVCGGTLRGRRVAVLGASFKPGSDDVRDSPALDVASQVASRGAVVSVYDPVATANAERAAPTLRYSASVREAADAADVVMHLTEWDEFRELDPSSLNDVVSARIVLDGRNTLDADRWRSAGWTYRGLGRP